MTKRQETEAKLAALTAEAEALAAENLPKYKRKLFWFALLGYAVIFGVLLLLVGLVGGLSALAFWSTAFLIVLLKKKILFILVPVIWVLLRALWVKLDSPQGYELTRSQYPELFARINKMGKKLKAPKVHSVILTGELNAAVVQTPRLGIFGWNKNTIVLGLELLLVLTPQQAEAVLAHEFGHLSGNHSKFNGWIYRVREVWSRVMDAFHQSDNIGANMMRRFFDWYSPRFSAYSFALARINEYQADNVAAEITDKKTAGNALINVYVTGPYVEENYWQAFFKSADDLPKPEHMPWLGFSRFMNEHLSAQKELKARLDSSLKYQTTYHDTHPSLSDRLKNLGVEGAVPAPQKENAAEVWLGKRYDRVIREFDADWLDYNKVRWSKRYQHVTESKARLEKLREQKNERLNDEMLWEKATLEEEHGKTGLAVSAYRAYQLRYPDNAVTAYCLGRLAFEGKDDRLLIQMKKAITQDDLVVDACQYAYHFLVNRDRDYEAVWWKDLADKKIETDELAAEERAYLTADDVITQYRPSDELRSYIVDVLEAHGDVKKAWIAKKEVAFYPESPAITITVQGEGLFVDHDTVAMQIREQLDLNFTFYVVGTKGDHEEVAKEIVSVGTLLV